jgi:hypothetical protein
MKMTDITECKQCHIQIWKEESKQLGGLCYDCYEYLKNKEMSKSEKVRRREENSYWSQTGKYK